MKKDRDIICKILSEMLDNPDEYEIYPTATAYTKLELYIEGQRIEAISSTYGYICSNLDKDIDPRIQEVPEALSEILDCLAE